MKTTYCYGCKYAKLMMFDGTFTNRCPYAAYDGEAQRGGCDKYEVAIPVRVCYYNANGVCVSSQKYLRREEVNEERVREVAEKCKCTYKIEDIV